MLGNLGLLGYFKYYDFLAGSLTEWLSLPPDTLPVADVLLPVGISFYTFQTLSYTISVYRRELPPEPHLGYFALYVSFFPQLVAGPIERPQHLLPQLHRPRPYRYHRVAGGLKLMAWGLFKKVVVAERLAVIVDPAYASPDAFSGPQLSVATLAFAGQIYCDFSGYSDMAIGAAQVLGVRLMDNFRRPYAALSLRDFWQRWHVSLSTWFRDYVYLPLGGSRVAVWRRDFNLVVVFLVSGLWHGANWTFVIWGAWHGVFMIAERHTHPWRQRLSARLRLQPRDHTLLGWISTFALVNVGWVLFRAESLEAAWTVLRRLPTGWTAGYERFLVPFGLEPATVGVTLAATAALFVCERGLGTSSPRYLLHHQPAWVRWPAYHLLVLAILLFGSFEPSPFIYFQF